LRLSLIGASATVRATSGTPTLSSAPRWSNERPELLRASPNDLQLRELPTNAGLAAGVQAPKQASYNTAYLRRPLSEVAVGALPGVAGIVLFTAAGICLG